MLEQKGKYRKEIIDKFQKKFNYELVNDSDNFVSRLERATINFNHSVSDRRTCGWELQAYTGYRIWDNSFMDVMNAGMEESKVVQSKTMPVFINNVRKILNSKASKMQVAAINVNVELTDSDPERRKTALALEKMLQFWVKRLRLKRKLDEPNQHSLYVGEGCIYYYWDTLDRGENALNGKPRFDLVTPFDRYRDSRTRRKDKSDSRYEFIIKHSTVEEVMDLYGVDIDKIRDSFLSDNETDPSRSGASSDRDSNVDIVIMQEKVEYYHKTVTAHYKKDDTKWLIDEDNFRKAIVEPNRAFLAERYDVPVEELTELMIWDYLRLEDNALLEDGLVAYPPKDSRFTGVFEYVFIPDCKLLLEEAKYVGKDFTFINICCEYIPRSAYSFGHAWFERDMLTVASLLLTSIVKQTERSNKLIPIIAPMALANHANFIANIDDPNTIPDINPNWKPSYPGERPIYWLKPPDLSQVITQFADKFLVNIEDNMMSPDVARGMNNDALSGRAVIAQQNAAASGSRSDFYSLEEAIIKIMYRMAEDIAINTDYEHSVVIREEDGSLTNIHINANKEKAEDIEAATEQNATQLEDGKPVATKDIVLTIPISDIIDDASITVQIDDSEETKKLMEQQAMMTLAQLGYASPEDIITKMPNLSDPQSYYENYIKSNQAASFAQQVSQLPQETQQKLFEMVSNAVQTGSLQLPEQTEQIMQPEQKQNDRQELSEKEKAGV